ncbi:hypothetical protein NLU13_2984 [Sarocladium strictum]|uniref:Secreted protein n=1 Tax=Sarocladium strictum TaxID=5046 RepID=A0AA39GMZ1_SARSR|nr:hypothetical protein NLU13_2984 [Sarocladium strictum]
MMLHALPLLLLAGKAACLAVVTVPPPGDGIQRGPSSFSSSSSSSSSISCDLRYCDGSTSWCHYWAGITTYDPTLGPLPGETLTSIGLCGKTVSSVTWTPTPASVVHPTSLSLNF